MSVRRVAAVVILAAGMLPASHRAIAQVRQQDAQPSEARISVGGVSLYARTIGRGPAVIVLHGGPDFDQAYLLPEFDQLSDTCRLIYYDQRGRGKSAAGVRPEDVTLTSDVEDLDAVRQYYRLDAPVVLGHSWGAVLALEYALRHPDRVSRLILMNPAPVSARDLAEFRRIYVEKMGADMDRQNQIRASAAYREGDPSAVTARYRIHFKPAFARAEDYEKLMSRMEAAFHNQGKEGIIKARAVEDRLMHDTWNAPGYDLLPKLHSLQIPTLVIVGDHDFIPVDIAVHVAQAIPNAKLVTIENCGHFAYLECAPQVRRAVTEFFSRTNPR